MQVSAPIKVPGLAAKMPSPELGVGHAAPRFHQAARRRGDGVAVRRMRAAINNAGDRVSERFFP